MLHQTANTLGKIMSGVLYRTVRKTPLIGRSIV